jgi:hypothetical protein
MAGTAARAILWSGYWPTENGGATVMTMDPETIGAQEVEERPLVLLAIEPRSYAQAIGGAVATARPNIEVLVVEPGDIPSEMERRKPALVLCSGERPDGCAEAVRWAEFSPYEEPEVVKVDGVPHAFPGLGLADILWLVDLHAAASRRG